MVGEEVKATPSVKNVKTYGRSSSWTERSPTQVNSRPTFKNESRAALPPLQPLSINKPAFNDWPMPGSDDLGVWLNSPKPAVEFLTPREWLGVEPVQRLIEMPREKLAFFNKECSKIVEYIFLGGDAVAKNKDVLLQNGVTHVLNCAGSDCPEYFKDEFVYKTLWLQDSVVEDITNVMYGVFDYFEDVRNQGGKVFVHCSHGVSRSPSLVIGYLMWKEEQSFEDAFQLVKSARRVANPNMGFVCQLLQYQRRLRALPPTPSSVLRMFWMTPHSSHDPLHLVPKQLDEPGVDRLDSRGAFIIHNPLVIYVWIGKHCLSMLTDNAKAAAFHLIRYERALRPAIIIKEGEEPSEFWRALGIETTRVEYSAVGQRLVQSYNIGFEIFHKAVSRVVVPPLSSGSSKTPSVETGFSRLRKTSVTEKMKDPVALTRLCSITSKGSSDQKMSDANGETEGSSSPAEPSSPSSPLHDSDGGISPYVTIHRGSVKDSRLKQPIISHDPVIASNPSLTSPDSYFRSASSYAFPSISPSKSNSERSSLFSFSPSSFGSSDLSYLSAQPPPSGLESKDL